VIMLRVFRSPRRGCGKQEEDASRQRFVFDWFAIDRFFHGRQLTLGGGTAYGV
jgi:hypothetical protein